MAELPGNGLVHLASPYGVPETVARLEAVLTARGIPVLARIDHSLGAAKAGLMMPPTELIIFGNAKAGTPVMLVAPTAAIDLPLKALIWEDGDGKVRVTYNSPQYVGLRHQVPDDILKNITGISVLMEETVRKDSE